LAIKLFLRSEAINCIHHAQILIPVNALLLALCLVFLGMNGIGAEPAKAGEPSIRLPVMTWYHPLLEPGISDILLLCTVSAVKPAEPVYGNEYWQVTLQIEESLFVAPRYHKKLESVRFIESGDFRKRTVGERIILFAGGEAYDGDDFLLPCWSGTETDLGILLHPKGHDEEEKDLELLHQLRHAIAGEEKETDLLSAFAEFCPKGVAHHLIKRLTIDELREAK
jgi:hypothetical protein